MPRKNVRPGSRWLWAAALFALLATGALSVSSVSAAPNRAGSPLHPVGSAPHPWAIRVSGAHGLSPLYSGHYWAGAYYTGNSTNSTQVSMTLKVPDATPSSSEFYYVLLSVWDDAGSYDQIGFTNDAGVWGFTYSYTSSCAGSYYYNPAYTSLTRGVTYNFLMALSSSGNLTFLATSAGKTVVKLTKLSGGKHFLEQSYYSCSSSTYYDYTDYEEIYTSVQSMPSFNYVFTNNQLNTTPVTNWSSMGGPLGGGTILASGSQVTVANEQFSLSFAVGAKDVAKSVRGATSYKTSLVLSRIFGTGNVSVKYWAVVSGAFTVTFSPTGGTSGFTCKVTVHFVSTTRGTSYPLTFAAINATGAYTYLTLRLLVR